MFGCKCCKEKDKRIDELKEQIEYLKALTIPNNDTPYEQPLSVREADFTLSGEVEPITPSENDEEELRAITYGLETQEDVLRERDRILAGTF